MEENKAKILNEEIKQLNQDLILNRNETKIKNDFNSDLQIAKYSNFDDIKNVNEIFVNENEILVFLYGINFPQNTEQRVNQVYLKMIRDLNQYLEKSKKIFICLIIANNQMFCISLAKKFNLKLPLDCLLKTEKIMFINPGIFLRSYFFIKSFFYEDQVEKQKYQMVNAQQLLQYISNFNISQTAKEILKDGQITSENSIIAKKLQYLNDYKKDEQGIPIYLSTLIKYFDSRQQYLKYEGIFRVQPSKADTLELEQKLQNEEYNCLDDKEDPRLATSFINFNLGLIKGFFINLEIPIIPFEFYDQYLQCQPQDSIELTQKLPEYNKKILGYLFQFLRKISKYSVENKMNESNLATCFMPCLFKRQNSDQHSVVQEMMDAKVLSKVLEHMIKYFKYSHA